MKLELKHLAPYLPYGLMFIHDGIKLMLFNLELPHDQNPMWITGLIQYKEDSQKISVFPEGCKPILRSLSDLINDKKFNELIKEEIICADCKITLDEDKVDGILPAILSIEVLGGQTELLAIDGEISPECSLIWYQYMIENHYDINNLIENNLAININTL